MQLTFKNEPEPKKNQRLEDTLLKYDWNSAKTEQIEVLTDLLNKIAHAQVKDYTACDLIDRLTALNATSSKFFPSIIYGVKNVPLIRQKQYTVLVKKTFDDNVFFYAHSDVQKPYDSIVSLMDALHRQLNVTGISRVGDRGLAQFNFYKGILKILDRATHDRLDKPLPHDHPYLKEDKK